LLLLYDDYKIEKFKYLHVAGEAMTTHNGKEMANNILVNGASGRIGRAVTYELSKDSTAVAVLNDLVPIDSIVRNFKRRDSTHGTLDWEVEKVDDSTIKINGQEIKVFNEKDPSKIPLRDYGVTIVEECSGVYAEKLDPHAFLDAGAERVIMSYPAKIKDATLVVGVNHQIYDPRKHRLISNGSCTTKALVAPLAVLLNRGITIESCLMNTIHSATNSQRVLDFGDKYATLNQIATAKTGAATAAAEVIPMLKGKMGGLSYRVPTTDGSIADIFLVASYPHELDSERLNSFMREAAEDPRSPTYQGGRIAIHDEPEIASADIIGRTENAIFVPSKTQVHKLPYRSANGNKVYHIRFLSAYDNEMGPPRDQAILTDYIRFFQ